MNDRTPDGIGPGARAAAAGELSGAQRTAIEWLTAGETTVAAAAAAGVSRSTVHRWLRVDAAFGAAFNAWQADAVADARARLLALGDAAVSAVAAAVAKGDVKTALTVLQRQGLLAPPSPGPADAALVARQRSHARAKANREMTEAECEVPPEIYDPAPRRAPAALPHRPAQHRGDADAVDLSAAAGGLRCLPAEEL